MRDEYRATPLYLKWQEHVNRLDKYVYTSALNIQPIISVYSKMVALMYGKNRFTYSCCEIFQMYLAIINRDVKKKHVCELNITLFKFKD